jgi:hypothetical protein
MSYEKEVATYQQLIGSDAVALNFPKPVGWGEWPSAKYTKTIGRRISSISKDKNDRTIFVLMLEFLDVTPLSIAVVSKNLAMAVLRSLAKMHKMRIIHGAISTTNIFRLGDEESLEIVWMDFSSSWTDASPTQIAWEMDRALEYFAIWVYSMQQLLADDVGWSR